MLMKNRCPVCDREISEDNSYCPECGFPVISLLHGTEEECQKVMDMAAAYSKEHGWGKASEGYGEEKQAVERKRVENEKRLEKERQAVDRKSFENEKRLEEERQTAERKRAENEKHLEKEGPAEERKTIEKAKKPKKGKKILASVGIVAILCIVLFFVVTMGDNPSHNSSTLVSTLNMAYQPGKYVTFGNYEQDNNTANGAEDIEWLVLARDGDKALLISKYALDCQKYNTSDTSVTWESCTLREWMNETFLNAAFSSEEAAKIETTTVTADSNPMYSTSAGNDTQDQVFLLSITEVEKYFSSDDDRRCVPTAYAIAQGAYTFHSYSAGGAATCWWWLRSPGTDSFDAALVNDDGSVRYSGYFVDCGLGCVRPALWINLES